MASSVAGIVRDAMIVKLTALLTSKTRITKPRAIALNNDNLLKDGWGIYIGATSQGEQSLGFHVSVKTTEINVILTQKIYTTDNNHTAEASAEDTFNTQRDAIVDSFADILKESAVEGLLDIQYQGDDGGVFIFGEKTHHMAMTINFGVTYNLDKTYN